MPRASAGKYDLLRCFRWYASHLRKKNGSGVDTATILRDKIKTNTIRADRAEYELAQVKSHLVPVENATEAKRQLHEFYCLHMLKITDLAIPKLQGLESRVLLEAALEDAVREAFDRALAAHESEVKGSVVTP